MQNVTQHDSGKNFIGSSQPNGILCTQTEMLYSKSSSSTMHTVAFILAGLVEEIASNNLKDSKLGT